MPRHDFGCACGRTHRDVVVPAAVGALTHIERCECGELMDWIPGTTAMDVGGVKGAAFKAFDTYDGRNRRVRVNSLRDLRRLERESEQQARDGEGQPLVFRRWSQDASNADQHAIHRSYEGGAQPDPAWLAKQRIGRVGGADTPLGPGVTEANASALPK